MSTFSNYLFFGNNSIRFSVFGTPDENPTLFFDLLRPAWGNMSSKLITFTGKTTTCSYFDPDTSDKTRNTKTLIKRLFSHRQNEKTQEINIQRITYIHTRFIYLESYTINSISTISKQLKLQTTKNS